MSRKNYGEPRQDQYAYQQAAILQEHFHRFFRGKGLDESNEKNRCSYLKSFMFGSALSNFLKSEVIKMAEFKPEETLHNYLRRYFEKISKGMTNQFAEQRELSRMQVIPNTRPSAGDGS
ncbi:MAG TPA: hypothetical protein VFE27_20645 [Acidobacteriaceae bacterium]|nr:hypothetical protein [Acidobacteriaceae bacterium]